MKLTKNADSNKYGDSGFDTRSQFLLPSGDWGKNVVAFGAENSLTVHSYLVLSEGPNNG